MLEGSDIVIDDVVSQDGVIASVAMRTPDLIVFAIDLDASALANTCRALKANPATVSLPLVALARSSRSRLAAFDAGVDDFLTHQIRREEVLVRVNGLLRAAASRRRLAAEQLAEEVRMEKPFAWHSAAISRPKWRTGFWRVLICAIAVLTGMHSRASAAVMFADMRGFTAISERLPPSEVVALLNQFFGLLTDITFEYDGTIFNMAGDSLLVAFGVPVEQADGAQRAIAAARQMLLRLNVLAERWKATHDIEIGLGIGINVGEVIAGNVGSASYMNYTIIGDTVNVAARSGAAGTRGGGAVLRSSHAVAQRFGSRRGGAAVAADGPAWPFQSHRHLLRAQRTSHRFPAALM